MTKLIAAALATLLIASAARADIPCVVVNHEVAKDPTEGTAWVTSYFVRGANSTGNDAAYCTDGSSIHQTPETAAPHVLTILAWCAKHQETTVDMAVNFAVAVTGSGFCTPLAH